MSQFISWWEMTTMIIPIIWEPSLCAGHDAERGAGFVHPHQPCWREVGLPLDWRRSSHAKRRVTGPFSWPAMTLTWDPALPPQGLYPRPPRGSCGFARPIAHGRDPSAAGCPGARLGATKPHSCGGQGMQEIQEGLVSEREEGEETCPRSLWFTSWVFQAGWWPFVGSISPGMWNQSSITVKSGREKTLLQPLTFPMLIKGCNSVGWGGKQKL